MEMSPNSASVSSLIAHTVIIGLANAIEKVVRKTQILARAVCCSNKAKTLSYGRRGDNAIWTCTHARTGAGCCICGNR